MNTRKGRHSNAAFTAHVFQDGLRQNEAEFEAFVQQFPIDDSISECFALASETESKSPLPKFVTVSRNFPSPSTVISLRYCRWNAVIIMCSKLNSVI